MRISRFIVKTEFQTSLFTNSTSSFFPGNSILRSVFAISVIASIFSLFVTELPAFAETPIVNNKKVAISKSQYPTRFKKFLHEKNGSTIINDPLIIAAVNKVMGRNADEFWSCAQLSHDPVVSGKFIVLESCVRGLCKFMYGIVCIDTATGACFVDYLNDTTDHVYGADCLERLPSPMRNMLVERQHTIAFEKTLPPKAERVHHKVTLRKLNLKSLTGTYTRDDGTRFIDSTLQILEQADGTVLFNIQANNGGHTGFAEGKLSIKDHQAIYVEGVGQGKGSLRFKFNPGKIIITGDDLNFCGMGVTLLGTYSKTADNPPKLTVSN